MSIGKDQMSAISNLSAEIFKNKIAVKRSATLDITVHLGLWKDQTEWLSLDQQLDFWYQTSVLEKASVMLEIYLGNDKIFEHIFSDFKTIELHHEFEDTDTGPCDLRIKISNLGNLLVRNNTGSFVCGMFEIRSLGLQGVPMIHMLEDTFFGVDSEIVFSMSRPIYTWMVDNHRRILPNIFPHFAPVDQK